MQFNAAHCTSNSRDATVVARRSGTISLRLLQSQRVSKKMYTRYVNIEVLSDQDMLT
jgi:hypothetical protein